MQTLETVKSRSQAGFTTFVEKVKEQPNEVKTWGMTASGAVVGAVALTAVANGLLAVLATLAAPPVALTVGAVGGGLIGWNYMRNRQTAPPSFTPPAPEMPIVVESTALAEGDIDATPAGTEMTPTLDTTTGQAFAEAPPAETAPITAAENLGMNSAASNE